MSKPIINTEDTVIRDTPGHWRYVIDDEEEYESLTDKSQTPDFTPAGHWEWQPSAMEAYRAAGYAMIRFPRLEPGQDGWKRTG